MGTNVVNAPCIRLWSSTDERLGCIHLRFVFSAVPLPLLLDLCSPCSLLYTLVDGPATIQLPIINRAELGVVFLVNLWCLLSCGRKNVVLWTRFGNESTYTELEADHAKNRRGELHMANIRGVAFSKHSRHPAERISDIIRYGCHVLFTR